MRTTGGGLVLAFILTAACGDGSTPGDVGEAAEVVDGDVRDGDGDVETEPDGEAEGGGDAESEVAGDDGACVPDCADRECGPDPVCGTDCGPACSGDEGCASFGLCVPTFGLWIPLPPTPAGGFLMGSPAAEAGRFANESQHAVTLTHGLLILSTEVTQSEFETRMGYNPSLHAGCAACPVEQVDWHEAARYCNALSAAADRPLCYECGGIGTAVTCMRSATYATPYDCPGYRLPTEAEWEYAARAGDGRATYNGDLDAGHLACEEPNAVLDSIAWFCGNSGGASHQAGTALPNAWGLHDMPGNAFEWCNDASDGADYAAGPATDPWGLATGAGRSLRGGSWFLGGGNLRAAFRFSIDATHRGADFGLRPVRSLP